MTEVERFYRVPGAFAQGTNYDLIIRGGRVIDPSLRLDAIRDVAIANVLNFWASTPSNLVV